MEFSSFCKSIKLLRFEMLVINFNFLRRLEILTPNLIAYFWLLSNLEKSREMNSTMKFHFHGEIVYMYFIFILCLRNYKKKSILCDVLTKYYQVYTNF